MDAAFDREYDPEFEAEAAMRRALAACGNERQSWIDLALNWQRIGRMREMPTSTAGPPVEEAGRFRS